MAASRAEPTRAMLSLSLVLLLGQVMLPWFSRDFTTQDGPSHLYTSHVVSRLAASDPAYTSIYSLRSGATSNQGTLLVLGAITRVVGVQYAEQAFLSLSLCVSFAGLVCLGRSMRLPQYAGPWLNFLLNTWFIWIGFHNFTLAAGLSFFCLSLQVRFLRSRMKWNLVAAAVVGLAVFYTHALVAVVTLTASAGIALWVLGWRLVRNRHSRRGVRRPLAAAVLVFASLLPLLAMVVHFLVKSAGTRRPFEWTVLEWALHEFPMHVFASGRGRFPEQALLWPAVLFIGLAGVLSFSRLEARRFQGAFAMLAIVLFAAYLVVPNEGYGGDEIKIRLSWFCSVFLVMAAVGARSLRPVLPGVGLVMTLLMVPALVETCRSNVVRAGSAAHEYARVLDNVPRASTLVRLNYTSEQTRKRLDYDGVALEPLLHVESKVAAGRDFIDLSDYQALAGIFPTALAARFSDQNRRDLWALENYTNEGTAALWRILGGFPARVDYVVVVGDETGRDRQAVLEELGRRADLVATDSNNSFLWLFRRRGTTWARTCERPCISD